MQNAEGKTEKNQPQGLVPSRDAGRALDALVAEKVMGLARDEWSAVCHVERHLMDEDIWCYDCQKPSNETERVPPRYSADLAAAWLVVERVQSLHPGWRFSLLGGDVCFGYKRKSRGADDYVVDTTQRHAFGWRASFFGHEDPTQNYGQRHADEWAEAPALAICRAALLALGAQ